MQKNNSFIWFLVFAVYCAVNTLCTLGLISVPLILVMYILCCLCSGRNALLTAGISAVFATAGLALNKGAFGILVFMLITALCFAFAYLHSYGYTKTAFIITVSMCLGIVSAVALAVYQSTGVITPQAVIGWMSDGFDEAGRLYTTMLSQTYGTSLEEMTGISSEQLIAAVKTASLNMLTGTVLLISSVTAIAGTALSFKVKYPKVSLLDTYVLSPVGGIVMLIALIGFSAAGGKTMVIAGNVYMAFLPWFVVSGIKSLRRIFVKKHPVSLFTVVAVAIIAFSVGILAALVFMGATEVIRGFVSHEK